MKHLSAFALLLSLALAGCGKKSDDPQARAADPFLGHWVADSQHDVDYYAPGQISPGHDNTYRETYWLDVAPATYEDWHMAKVPAEKPRKYTRAGAVLTTDDPVTARQYEARNLTPDGFTYVITTPHNGGGSNVLTMTFHR